ncbi:MAG: aminotransferase V [Acidobacteria bacterium]|nr:MAG: aminotransferase V [Acidobacteriota bacterium]
MTDSPRFRFKIASEASEFEQIHGLNHRTFAEEIPQHRAHPSGRLVDRFHEENTYAICLAGSRLAGMVALRGRRPFSLDQKLPDLDSYLPAARSVCELRLLAVERGYRAGRVAPALLAYLWRHLLDQGYDLAVISGTTRQLKLYRHLGFVPFGPLVGTEHARYQPMMLTLERFAARAPVLFRRQSPPARPRAASFLPGPVAIHEEVQAAFQQAPRSHRAEGFAADLERTRALLCDLAGASRVQVLLGSGTLANDAVAGQLSLGGARGLVLTNGEFGERLVDHARRFRLAFDVAARPWGAAFDLAEIGRRVAQRPPGWLWCVHGETSTGVLNDLDGLEALCCAAGVKLCVDAISSIGNVPLRLGRIHLATGVSGKGLGAFPGLSFVFHDHDLQPAPDRLPRYLDLGLYARQGGVPFTHSSNLLCALLTALFRVDWPRRHRERAETSAWLRARVRALGFEMVAAEADAAPGVVTIALPPTQSSLAVAAGLEEAGYLVHAHSEYLRSRNWIQICLMGESSREQIAAALGALHEQCPQPASA